MAFARLGGQGGRIEEKPPERRGKPELEAGALFLRQRQQKCRKLATTRPPRLNRGAGIDIMPRN